MVNSKFEWFRHSFDVVSFFQTLAFLDFFFLEDFLTFLAFFFLEDLGRKLKIYEQKTTESYKKL